MFVGETLEKCRSLRMRLSQRVVLLWIMALPVPALAGSHGTLDDLIELNVDYVQFEAAIHDLSVPWSTLTAARQLQLLGIEPGEAHCPGPMARWLPQLWTEPSSSKKMRLRSKRSF